MKIEDVLRTVNQMKADGVIERYAVGGAVGATFYLEPISTLDVDIFVELHAAAGSLILSLEPILQYLRDRGCTMEGEHIVISGWPVQFLPSTSPLTEEALTSAIEMDVQGIPTPIFTAEYLAAIALQTGRAKDKARLLQFIEASALDLEQFERIIKRHRLVEKWQRFQQQFME